MPTTFEIFPAIGYSRVGTSNEFYIGPEPDVPLDRNRRDVAGDLLRQAARFRIYQCDRDAAGKLQSAREITAADAQIEWTVHLVNRKAAAERFNVGQPGGGRRNNATGNDQSDQALIIDPGPKRIGNGDAPVPLTGGRFKHIDVPLGRLEIQADGRLLVIGGRGDKNSGDGSPMPPDADFADNDNWHDDVGDGPVRARVTSGGNNFEAKPAWVIVAPPDYAPDIQSIVTMYDALSDLAVQRGVLKAPPTIFFDRHVLPILDRAVAMQWVNRQARLGYDDTQSGGHGPDGGGDFSSMLAVLGDPAPANGTARKAVFRLLRDPDTGAHVAGLAARKRMPRLSDSNDSGGVLALTRTQYQALKLWSEGTFQSTDPTGNPVELLPDALTRMALEACTGGAFFPGIEAGRIMMEPSRYMDGEAYRLSPSKVKPGEITARNAVPWQTDFHLCRWEGGAKQLGWWPAQRPDDVMTSADGNPVPWTRGTPDNFQGMLDHWPDFGFVMPDPANPGVFIETNRRL
jgi:L-Lysine epsilon oxidase N-terminal/L-lysine epsilon oxidase C-terminal domain